MKDIESDIKSEGQNEQWSLSQVRNKIVGQEEGEDANMEDRWIKVPSSIIF